MEMKLVNEKSRTVETQFKEAKSGDDDLVADAIDRYLDEQRVPAKKKPAGEAFAEKRE
jgi:hypothetical protein